MASLGLADLTPPSKRTDGTNGLADCSSEKAFAALTSQGMEMIARGSVSTHHTVPWPILFFTGHGL